MLKSALGGWVLYLGDILSLVPGVGGFGKGGRGRLTSRQFVPVASSPFGCGTRTEVLHFCMFLLSRIRTFDFGSSRAYFP